MSNEWGIIREQALAKIGQDGLIRLAEQHGLKFTGRRRGDEAECHLDANDSNPSGSFNIPLGLLKDFRGDGSSANIEQIIGGGNYQRGCQQLIREAGLSITGSRGKRPVEFEPIKVIELEGQPKPTDLRASAPILDRFITDCVAYMKALPATHSMISYLVGKRGIPIAVAATRQMGVIPENRLPQLLNDLQAHGSPLAKSIERFPNFANHLVWFMRDRQFVTHIKTRGLPRPGTTNSKNMHTCTLVEDGAGWFGTAHDGPLIVTEGEFNLMAADRAHGQPINGICVGSSSTGIKAAEEIHSLSKDITVIGDDDIAGRNMVQAIADVGEIKGFSWLYRAFFNPCAGMRLRPPQKNMTAMPKVSA